MTVGATHDNPLRLMHCMQCGYSLETRDPEGTCPECGHTYDQRTVVLRGVWSGTGDMGTGSPGAMIAQIVAYLFWIFIAWIMYWSGDHFYAIALAVFLGVSVAVELTYRYLARVAGAGDALLQCRFNRFGCLQCDLPEEMIGAGDFRRLWRWVSQLLLMGIALGLLITHRLHWFWIGWIAMAVIGAARSLWLQRRAIRLAKKDADGRALMAAARQRGRQCAAIPWSAISEFRIAQFRRKIDRFYLTSGPKTTWWSGNQAINAEVEATVAQMTELQSRIEQWRSEAAVQERPKGNRVANRP